MNFMRPATRCGEGLAVVRVKRGSTLSSSASGTVGGRYNRYRKPKPPTKDGTYRVRIRASAESLEAREGERTLVKVVKAIAQWLFFFALIISVMWFIGLGCRMALRGVTVEL